jgi:hypothetical protein
MFQKHLRNSFFSQVFVILASSLLIVTLAGCGSAPDSSSTTPTPTATSSGGANTTATGTPTTTTQAPTPPPTAQLAAFRVSGISASVDHPTFTGICSNNMTRIVTGVIYAPANTTGGTVTYHWQENPGGTFQTQSVSFAPGQTSRTVTQTTVTGASWGNGSTLSLTLNVIAPNTFTSAPVSFKFFCQRVLTAISANVTPTFVCDNGNAMLSFSATLTVSPGPGNVPVTYHWYRSDGGTGQTTTVTVPDGQTSVIVTNSWSLGPPIPAGAYWEEVIASAPNANTSNQAVFDAGAC